MGLPALGRLLLLPTGLSQTSPKNSLTANVDRANLSSAPFEKMQLKATSNFFSVDKLRPHLPKIVP